MTNNIITILGLPISLEIIVTLIALVIIKVIVFSKRQRNVQESDHETFLPTCQQTRNLILNRRSIFPKEYKTEEKLSNQEIEMILEAANWAPTHAKNEPWRYAIIEGSQSIHEYFDFLESWYENHVDEISEEDMTRFKRKLYR